jgi:adenosylcobinamide-GDP ribazoletransferase
VYRGWLPGSAAAAALVVAALVGLGCGWRFRARAGGITGDFLGATQQVVECALLLSFALTLTAASEPLPW